MRASLRALGAFTVLLAGCATPPPPPKTPAEHTIEAPHDHPTTTTTAAAAPAVDPIEHALDEVALIHGAAGPWAVAGYRMSEHALVVLGLQRGSFDLQIVHWTPKQVKYACIADGAAASSGASLGKLNLSLVETTAENVLTVYRNKKTGRSIALRPSASFATRYADTPRDKAREIGREVMHLPDDQVFEEVAAK